MPKYDLMHWTIKNSHVSSSNAENKFLYSYQGWGCLSNVNVRIELKDGSTKSSTFNMCQSLGPDWNGMDE